jgi:hypothetical protein
VAKLVKVAYTHHEERVVVDPQVNSEGGRLVIMKPEGGRLVIKNNKSGSSVIFRSFIHKTANKLPCQPNPSWRHLENILDDTLGSKGLGVEYIRVSSQVTGGESRTVTLALQ